MRALGLRRVVLLTPYPQAANDHEKEFLAEFGIEVVHDVALACPSANDYLTIPVARWVELARELARVPADGFFLSCTNTTQIEAIEAIERETGKPVVIPTRPCWPHSSASVGRPVCRVNLRSAVCSRKRSLRLLRLPSRDLVLQRLRCPLAGIGMVAEVADSTAARRRISSHVRHRL